MKANDVLIKWIGSKRLQADTIINYFPKEIKTYYEPFLGGGSVLFCLLQRGISVECYEGSDLNKDLIALWTMVRDNPQAILDYYEQHWGKIDKAVYQQIRSEHNDAPDPRKFFLLLRTCRNGLIRYNKSGKFNSAFHFGRKGMTPDKVRDTVRNWSGLIKNVEFKHRSYADIQSKPGDLVYLDPPYKRSDNFEMYFAGHFEFDPFWAWMREQKGNCFLSLNGFKGELDCRVDVPKDLYDEFVLVDNGLNKFDQMVGNRVVAQDSLYIQRKS